MLSISGSPVKVLCSVCRISFTGAFRNAPKVFLNLLIVFADSGIFSGGVGDVFSE